MQTGHGEKRQRSSAGPVKVAVVLKPIRGKSSNRKTQCKKAANDSTQPVINRTLSTSTSSLESEMAEERSQDTLRKTVQEVVDKCGTTEDVEITHPSDEAGEESVENKQESSKETLTTDVNVEKPKSHSRVSIKRLALKYHFDFKCQRGYRNCILCLEMQVMQRGHCGKKCLHLLEHICDIT